MNDSKLYLCKADCSLLGVISGIKIETGNLTRNATDLWELTFEVNRFVEVDGKLVQSDYYDSINDMMKLYLDCNIAQAFFVIDSEPTITGDGFQEVKTVTAHSIEAELNHVYLRNFKVNCGTYDSQEFLVTDEDGSLVNNLDEYNATTMKWISLVDYDDTRYSLMHLILQNTDWKVKDNIQEDICTIKGCFDTSDSVYAFLMKTVSPGLSIIFEFDRKNKEIDIVKADEYGKDTGIFITMRNLMNKFEVTSSSEDSIITKIIPTGSNGLGIEQVNFGDDYIINLDYFMNTKNEYGDYKFVSQELHDKYNLWKDYRYNDIIESNITTIDGDIYFKGTNREFYKELTKSYNKVIETISELTNRIPNDGCFIDYKTYKLEELIEQQTAYNNALLALIVLYKSEYGVIEIGDAPDYIPTPATAISIKNTPYWYDYCAYKDIIIPKIENAIKKATDKDYEYKSIDSYLYQWDLYGLDELESKKKAWEECVNILYKPYFVKKWNYGVEQLNDEYGNTTYLYRDEYEFYTPTKETWDSLTEEQRLEFTSMDAFIAQFNQYLDYMSYEDRENSLTGTICKGIITQCTDAINSLKVNIFNLNILKCSLDNSRQHLVNQCSMNGFYSYPYCFTTEDLNVIKSLLRTKEYSNENIITTNLNDAVSTVDIQEDLYQCALEELDTISQPQYSFSTELDNLYAIEEFKEYREPFNVGNFIMVGLETHEYLYDNNFIKLRLMSISHNPFDVGEELSIEFSTMTKTLNTISDLAFLLDKQLSSGGSSSSSSSSGSSTYGNNDANVQMSNTMLNALLKTDLFGSKVNDVVLDSLKTNKGNFTTLFSQSGAFDAFESGKIKINGDCIVDKIKSHNWNGTTDELLNNTEGSIIDLNEGKFNFAGGKLKWDNSQLSIKGDVIAESFILGNNARITAGNDTIDKSDSYYDLDSSGTLKANNAIIHGTIYATNGEFSGDVIANTLTADQSGSIAGWKFDANTFYKNSNIFANENGMYLGNDGLSIKDVFTVDKDGNCVANNFSSNNVNILGGSFVLGEVGNETHQINMGVTSYSSYFNIIGEQSNALEGIRTKFTTSISSNSYQILAQNSETLEMQDVLEICGSEYDHIAPGIVTRPHILIEQYNNYGSNRKLYLSASSITCTSAYEQRSFSGLEKRALYVGSDGTIGAASSSRRYKQDISTELDDTFNPHQIYDLPVSQFRYKEEFSGGDNTELYIGFIAEDVAKYYPSAARWNEDHTEVDTWEMSDMFPALVKLIQEQHSDIEMLKKEIEKLKQL